MDIAVGQDSVLRHLTDAVARDPNKAAVIYHGRPHSYAQVDAASDAVANWLRRSGVRAGERVLCCSANHPQLIAALFGALKVGAIFVPIGRDTPPATVQYILDDCEPAAAIVDAVRWRTNRGLLIPVGGPVLCIGDESPADILDLPAVTHASDLAPEDGSAPQVDPKPDGLAIIIYTSGSTGLPRGVMLPNAHVSFAVKAINSVLQNAPDDIILCGLPLSFDYGLYQVFLAFHASATLALEADFSVPIAIPRILATLSITGFPAVPAVIAMLLRARLLERVTLPCLRYVTSTGDVFPIAHIRRLRALLPGTAIAPMYGLTECKRVSISPLNAPDSKIGSVGLPLPGTQVEVVDRGGRKLPPGATGELVVRGPHVMVGYWNAPEDTARRFRLDKRTGETVLHTGDAFHVDVDGYLFFVGREETTIKSLGHKVSTAEVENAACGVPGVAEAAAIGIPDEVRGEAVHLVISLEAGAELSSDALVSLLRDRLPPAARPSMITVLETPLPRTSNGKIHRSRLVEEMKSTRTRKQEPSSSAGKGACSNGLWIRATHL